MCCASLRPCPAALPPAKRLHPAFTCTSAVVRPRRLACGWVSMSRKRALPAKGLQQLFLALGLLMCVAYWRYKLWEPERCGNRLGAGPEYGEKPADPEEPLLPLLSPVLAVEVNRKLDPFRKRGITKGDVQRAFSLHSHRPMYMLAIKGNRLYVKVQCPTARCVSVICGSGLLQHAHSPVRAGHRVLQLAALKDEHCWAGLSRCWLQGVGQGAKRHR